MTEVERAKEYLLDSLTEDQIEKDLTDIASNFIMELQTREVFYRFIGEINAYMEIQQIEGKVESWYIEDLEDIYTITNYKVVVVFFVCGKKLKFKISI